MEMKLEKQSDGYWIKGLPDIPACGPYDRKADAQSDRRGMKRFLRHENERDFFTVEREPTHAVAT